MGRAAEKFRLCCQERHLPWLLDSATEQDDFPSLPRFFATKPLFELESLLPAQKRRKELHVAVGEHRRHGMHSLRHSLATGLMENGTPVEFGQALFRIEPA